MKLEGYYSSGQFAKMAQVSVRTIRFYDKQNILKPSYVNENGARFYTDSDLARLQQILLLKYLGFSLEDIREMLIDEADTHFMLNSLRLQKRLVQDRIEQMQLVEQAIENTANAMEENKTFDWSQMLQLIHLTGMETSLKGQYRDASNITARISLHKQYSVNTEGWFPWVFRQCEIKAGMRILEIGCGDGTLWVENPDLPKDVTVDLTDISEGMLRDARRHIGLEDTRFRYQVMDGHTILYPEDTFDLVIMNHVLFYCEDIRKVCREVYRVLKPGGRFICSTYGSHHMIEITELVQEFDGRIVLSSGERLYDRFGLENGSALLQEVFVQVSCRCYEDEILLDHAEPLIEYIMSCHGNQNQILLDKYKEFRAFVERKVTNGFHITKEAGIYISRKEEEVG